jgi:aminopeptidase N
VGLIRTAFETYPTPGGRPAGPSRYGGRRRPYGTMATMPSLTRAEAETRARLLDVHSYSVDLDLTRGEELFGSTTVIRFGCREPGSATFVELKAAALRRAVLNGRELDATALRDHRLALAGLAADNELRVEAEMRYSRTGEGMHRFTDPADGEAYVYTQCGPDEAPRVFACFDQPDLKAVLEVSVAACLARDDLTPTLRRVLDDQLDDLRRAVRIQGA